MCGITINRNKAEFCHHIEEGDSGYEKLREIFWRSMTVIRRRSHILCEAENAVFDFFYEMLTKHYIIPVSTEQNKSLAAVKEVLDHISLHYQENLTVSELSGLSNYSEYYFMKLFRQYTGKPWWNTSMTSVWRRRSIFLRIPMHL